MNGSRSQRRTGQWLVPDDPAEALARDGFGLGAWRVEPSQRRIVSRQAVQQLDPRLMDLLVFLASRPGQLVPREEILDTVWDDAVVSENTLTQAVSRLRRVLGDDPRAVRYIETVSRSGYRLVAVVEWPGATEPVAVEPLPGPPARRESRAAEGPAKLGHGGRWLLPLVALLALGGWLLRPTSRTVTPQPTLPTIRPALTQVGQQFDPVLSPDGQHVAFAWQGPGEGGYDSVSDFDLWVQQIDGEEPVQLTDHADEERLPTWSPDGLSLLFTRFSVGEQTCGIYRIPLIGGSANRLADCPPNLRWMDITPDGRSLSVSASQSPDEPRGIFRLDLGTGAMSRLTRAPDDSLGDHRPTLSPDGRWVAFERRESEFRHRVMLVAADGTGERALTADPWGQLRGVEWSSDSSSVLFASNRIGRFLLWRSSLAGGEPTRLPIEDDWVTQPSVAYRGDRLIYRTFRDVVDLYALPLAGPGIAAGEPHRILPSTRSERDPVWSPDGETIAFLSDRSGVIELWTGDRDGSGLLKRTDFGGPRPESPAWSPDGRTLIFDAATAGHADLWRLDGESRHPQRLTRDPGNERNAAFARDGSAIYFGSDRAGGWDIFRMPARGGPARRITRCGAFLAVESLDGTSLLVARPERPGIWRLPVAGGDPELVIEDLDLADWGSWAVAEDGIYFLRRQPTTIAFHSFSSGESRIVYQPPKQMPYLARNLSLAPDHRTLLFALIDHSDDEVMQVDWPGL